MAKRFTDTNKWTDPWFRKLTPNEKLVFMYLVDNCDMAGFIELDLEVISFHTGIQISPLQGAIKGLTRGYIEANGWLLIRNFLRHQKNDKLNPQNNAHKNIISCINSKLSIFYNNQDFTNWLAPNLGLISPTGKGNGKGNGKVMVEGGVGETISDDEINSRKLPGNHKTQFGIMFSDLEPLEYIQKHFTGLYESMVMKTKINQQELAKFNDKARYINHTNEFHFQSSFKKFIQDYANGTTKTHSQSMPSGATPGIRTGHVKDFGSKAM